MASISVTYTFVNATTASATEVNQNFTDIINGTSDGTKDFSIAALTCSGNATFNGNVTLGNASGDDVTVTGSLASSIPIKTQRTYDIGSADLGLRIIYLGGNSTHTIALQAPSSGMSADYSLNLPATAPVVGYGIQGSSTSATVWAPMQTAATSVSADATISDTDGYQVVLVTTSSTNRTITLPTAADNTGRTIKVVKVDTGTGTTIVDGENSETIDGDTTFTLYEQWDSVTVYCNGTAWFITEAIVGPKSRSNSHATRNGQKSYYHGTTYNGSVAPTVTSSISSLSVTRGTFTPYQMQDGTWRLTFNIVATHASSGGGTFTINGVTFKNTSGFRQVVASSAETAGTNMDAAADPNASTITCNSQNRTFSALSGDVELESKPTWAY